PTEPAARPRRGTPTAARRGVDTRSRDSSRSLPLVGADSGPFAAGRLRRSTPEHRALVNRRDRPLVNGEPASLILRAEDTERSTALFEHRLADLEIDRLALDVDRDRIAILDERERSARRRLGRRLADDEPGVDEPRELPLGDHRDPLD